MDTNLHMRRDTQPEIIGRYVYSAPVANYLLLALNSNCTRPAQMLGLQERSREDSDSSSDEEGIEESKTEASYEEPQLDSKTYTQVLTGLYNFARAQFGSVFVLRHRGGSVVVHIFGRLLARGTRCVLLYR